MTEHIFGCIAVAGAIALFCLGVYAYHLWGIFDR